MSHSPHDPENIQSAIALLRKPEFLAEARSAPHWSAPTQVTEVQAPYQTNHGLLLLGYEYLTAPIEGYLGQIKCVAAAEMGIISFTDEVTKSGPCFENAKPAVARVIYGHRPVGLFSKDCYTGHFGSARDFAIQIYGLNSSSFADLNTYCRDMTALPTLIQTHAIVKQTKPTILSRFHAAFRNRQKSITPQLIDAISWHLTRLLNDEEELAESNIVPSIISFSRLLNFVVERRWLRRPMMGLNETGQFTLAWVPAAGAKANLTLVFSDALTVKWLFADGRGSKGITSGAGNIDPKRFVELLAMFRCREWVSIA